MTPDMRAIAKADLIVTTPEKWDGVSRSWQNRSYVQRVAILIIDEIHLLGETERPPLAFLTTASAPGHQGEPLHRALLQNMQRNFTYYILQA